MMREVERAGDASGSQVWSCTSRGMACFDLLRSACVQQLQLAASATCSTVQCRLCIGNEQVAHTETR